jgi:hypothetical protein
MAKYLAGSILLGLLVLSVLAAAQNAPKLLPWNNAGLGQAPEFLTPADRGPAPRRDLTGIWDAGRAGIGAKGYPTAPLTAWGEQVSKTHKSGDGSRMAPVEEINDPLSTIADPAGFPRLLLFELRPFQVVQTPNEVLMLYMFEKRWRAIWTDGRQLPTNPEPRWYGYSVGHWEDDYTFVVETVGMTDRTWLDNSGNPHSDQMRVEERYHRVSRTSMELTVTINDPKTYTAPWTPRNKTPLTLLPSNMDLTEMIPSASETAQYRKMFVDQIQ